MKQCPRCKRTYADETLLYCLDDGSMLSAAYDPAATQVMPSPRTTNAGPTEVMPGYPAPPPLLQQRRSHWPVYVLISLLLLVIGGGAIALLIFGYSRLHDSSSAANMNQGSATQSSPAQNSPSPDFPYQSLSTPSDTPPSSPSASPTPQARDLVGVWRTNVVENNESQEITYTFFADGRSKAVFKTADGQAQTHLGAWRYSDNTLFETFPEGATGKGAINWIDHDTFEITIIDNGVPAYSGLKRRYRRIGDSATD
jgi:hypothetical protein